ncbi:PPOX class F420-dependent oxidoreductase [Natronococcus wangiae]|uniref:PPOX class F420-dependent oxidoreductase n=1 Tax=Natronococcus wangiae TaxID=3068275 RepID=UPI00273F9A2F|nr:PPOX class F420-dependent oxidoreductase [Natronococcus sp. AD5]
MSEFTKQELDYLDEQRLGRLATVGANSQPHVVPVGFRYDADEDAIDIGGRDFAESKKFREAKRNPRVAFVVDDLASIDPWQPRGIEIRGRAQTFDEGGERFGPGYDDAWMQIRPERIVSWGI